MTTETSIKMPSHTVTAFSHQIPSSRTNPNQGHNQMKASQENDKHKRSTSDKGKNNKNSKWKLACVEVVHLPKKKRKKERKKRQNHMSLA